MTRKKKQAIKRQPKSPAASGRATAAEAASIFRKVTAELAETVTAPGRNSCRQNNNWKKRCGRNYHRETSRRRWRRRLQLDPATFKMGREG